MGRLAGPLSKKRQEKERLRSAEDKKYFDHLERPEAPLVVPKTSRRHLALLWYIDAGSEHGFAPDVEKNLLQSKPDEQQKKDDRSPIGFAVGVEKRPAYTSDMKALVKKGELKIQRIQRWDRMSVTCLFLTEQGKATLSNAKLSRSEKDYIRLAHRAGAMR